MGKEERQRTIKHYSSISKFLREGDFTPAEHPMFFIQRITGQDIKRNSSVDSTSDFYIILLRKLKSGVITYGRTKYDFENGALLFAKPGQVFACNDVEAEPGGYTILIHKDFMQRTELGEKIKSYGFFDYAVNEALHLSPAEETRIYNLCENIEAEYHNNQDKFSKEIILSLLDTLLKYSDRFYQRQFINRKDLNSDLHKKFNDALLSYAQSNLFASKGVPTIAWVAEQLSVTARYLSDSIKAETGKTAIDLIHLFLVDEAKNSLLEPNASISGTAYKLGFEYPQYFSRLFKKKVGMTPREFIDSQSAN